jgi:superfamily II DNA/RNA helicase
MQREKALAEFRAGKYTTLVATDVAARGLHLNSLEHIVNYDFPPSLAQYVHRVGRAGRGQGSNSGTAFSFFTRNLRVLAPDLCVLLDKAGQKVDHHLRALAEEVAAGGGGSPAGEERDTEDAAVEEEEEEEDREGELQDQPGDAEEQPASDSGASIQSAVQEDDDVNRDEEVFGAVPLARFNPAAVLESNNNKARTPSEPRPRHKRVRPRGTRGGGKPKKTQQGT